MPLNHFLERAVKDNAFVFIALHGGEGENGTLQSHLEKYQIPYNGSNPDASALCMDKYLTGQTIQRLGDPDLLTIPKKCLRLADFEGCLHTEFEFLWQELSQELGSGQLIVKPRSDGCSAGIALLQSSEDLERYCTFLYGKAPFIPPFSFANQSSPIEMPTHVGGESLFEPYIEIDPIVIEDDHLSSVLKKGWIELTVGVLEKRGFIMP